MANAAPPSMEELLWTTAAARPILGAEPPTLADRRSIDEVAHLVKTQLALVEANRQLIFELRRNGHPSDTAEQSLRRAQEALHMHRKDLAKLQIAERLALKGTKLAARPTQV